jgi:hypothetical protein
MSMDTKMKEFFEGDHLKREIHIADHCTGFRVTLFNNHKEISSSTGVNVESAFDHAMQWFEKNRIHKIKMEQEKIKSQITYHEKIVNELTEQLRKAQKE